jgi:20S proteasome alpha/beta subunit
MCCGVPLSTVQSLAAMLSSQDPSHTELAALDGTLVVTTPYADGLIVAADSRSTLYGVQCDGNVKIVFPDKSQSSFVAGTGMSEWVSVKIPLWEHDPCGDIAKNGITFFDAKAIATKFIDDAGKRIADLDLAAFSHQVIAAINAVAASGMAAPILQSFTAREVMFAVIFGEFDSDTQTSVVRSVEFSMPNTTKIDAHWRDQKYGPNDKPGSPYFGDFAGFNTHVMNGPGHEHLPPIISTYLAKQVTKDVTFEEAQSIAIGMIEAAKKTSETIPALLSIGGPVSAYAIDSKGRRKLR